MPTDPYVPSKLEDRPRQLPNLAPGVAVPPARAWHADRPGDLESADLPSGALLGAPGPNVGYALTLAHRCAPRLHLGAHEHLDDVLAVLAEIAMRRAARFGRAPVMGDVRFASTLLGYNEAAGGDVFEWRQLVVQGAHHDYVTRRKIVDTIPASLLEVDDEHRDEQLVAFRRALRGASTNG